MDTVHCKAIFGKGLLAILHLCLLSCLHIFIWKELSFHKHTYNEYIFVNYSSGFVNSVPVFLAKPQTYMNLSGEAVSDLHVSSPFLWRHTRSHLLPVVKVYVSCLSLICIINLGMEWEYEAFQLRIFTTIRPHILTIECGQIVK